MAKALPVLLSIRPNDRSLKGKGSSMLEISAEFLQSVQALERARERFEAGELKAVPYSQERELALSRALRALAVGYGVPLYGPLTIDSRGEFSLIAANKEGLNPHHYGTGQYGEDFVSLLNQFEPRTGERPGQLCAVNGWCHMNHFNAERMVLAALRAHGEPSRAH
jgi:hypothetical protein